MLKKTALQNSYNYNIYNAQLNSKLNTLGYFIPRTLGKKVTLMFLGQLSRVGTTFIPTSLLSNTVQQLFPEHKRHELWPKSTHFPLNKQNANKNDNNLSILPP